MHLLVEAEMSALAQQLCTRAVLADQLALYWLCQAGFAFKMSNGKIIYIDPYLSDVVEREIGFKRMMACPIAPADVAADLVICTHEHLDHMDTDALPLLARNSSTHFVGPIECIKEFERLGMPKDRCHLIEKGDVFLYEGLEVHPVYADHGELAPDALGIVLDFGCVKVYHTGDTAYRPEEFNAAIDLKPEILLPCINGAFGNMNADEAANLTELIAPRVVIPTHFWMFVEQNGNPAHFLQLCAEHAPKTKAILLKPGEEFLFDKNLQ
jgi:L-ascorbate 6-phosphate lactonase